MSAAWPEELKAVQSQTAVTRAKFPALIRSAALQVIMKKAQSQTAPTQVMFPVIILPAAWPDQMIITALFQTALTRAMLRQQKTVLLPAAWSDQMVKVQSQTVITQAMFPEMVVPAVWSEKQIIKTQSQTVIIPAMFSVKAMPAAWPV